MIRALALDYYNVLASPTKNGWELNLDLLHYIQSIKSAYKLALVSNSYAKSLNELNPQLGEKLFDCVLIGGASGLWKPDDNVYQTLQKKLGLEAAQILIIDDNPRHLELSKKLGFATYLYNTDSTTSEIKLVLDTNN